MGGGTGGAVAEAGEKSGLATTTLGDRNDNRRQAGLVSRMSRDVACQEAARGVVFLIIGPRDLETANRCGDEVADRVSTLKRADAKEARIIPGGCLVWTVEGEC